MPPSSQRKRKGQGEVMPPLNVYDRIDSLLKHERDRHLSTKPELTDEEIANWHRYLEPFPLPAIEWAFENWNRIGRFFPVYRDILDFCEAWDPPGRSTRGCPIECRERHGKGYSENDMVKLWKMYSAKKDELPNRPMTDGEINTLLDDLDRWRGSVPEWRA